MMRIDMAEHFVDFLGKFGSGSYTATDRQIEKFIGLARKNFKERYRGCFHNSSYNDLLDMYIGQFTAPTHYRKLVET